MEGEVFKIIVLCLLVSTRVEADTMVGPEKIKVKVKGDTADYIQMSANNNLIVGHQNQQSAAGKISHPYIHTYSN